MATVSIRLGVEGQAELRRTFDDVAKGGEAAFGTIGGAMDRAGRSSEALEARVRKLSDSARQAGVAMQSSLQQNLDRMFGIDAGSPKSASGSASVFQKDMATTALRAKALREAIDPVGAAAGRMGDAIKTADGLLAKGAITAAEHASAIALAKRGYETFAASLKASNDNIGFNNNQMQQLGHVGKAMFDMVMAGQSPMHALTVESGRLGQALSSGSGGLAGGMAAAKDSAASLLSRFSPMVGAIGGVTTAVATAAAAYENFASRQRDLALGLVGTGVTASGVNRVADANYSISDGLSSQSIREMSVTFAQTRKIGVEMFGDLSKFAHDYAKVTGTDLPTATKTVATSMADLSKGALDLNGQIGGLDGRTYDLIRRMDAAGDHTGAQRLALASLSRNIEDAKLQVSSFATAWDALAAAASRGWEGVGRGVARGVFGGFDLDDQLRGAREVLENSKSRRWIPIIGERDVKIAEDALHALEKLKAARDDLAKSNTENQKSLEGSLALSAITPSRADIEQLTKWQTALREALNTGNASSGTEDALKRINEILKAGGTEAFNLKRAATDAFDQAGLLPFEKRIAAIDTQFRNLIEAANGDKDVIAGLMGAKGAVSRAAVAEATRGPMLEANLGLNTQIANLKVQRDSFLLSAGAAGEMAARQDMLNRYTREGVPITDALNRSIEAYAKRAGEAAEANDKLQRTQQNIVGGMDELRSGTSGILTGIFSDKRQGKDPLANIQSSLGRMTDQLFDRIVSKPLTEQLLGFNGKGGGGLFGDMASKLFGDVSGIKVPQATINATTVTVNGGGLTGGAGTGGLLGNLFGSKGTGEVETYVRQAALARGIDPDIAARVIKQESGFNIFSKNITDRESSFGVMQLNTKGGLGVDAMRVGIDPTDPSQWRKQVDFGLDMVAKDGWRQWFGARDIGVGRWDGIGKKTLVDDDDGGYATASDSVGKLTEKISALPKSADGLTDSLGKVGDKFTLLSSSGGLFDEALTGIFGKQSTVATLPPDGLRIGAA